MNNIRMEKPLLEVFVVLGIKEKLPGGDHSCSEAWNPDILDIYPSSSKEFVQELKLSYICSPTGYKPCAFFPSSSRLRFNHLSIVNKFGEKLYGSTLQFYSCFPNQFKIGIESVYFPLCFCIISRLPIYDFHKALLLIFHKAYLGREEYSLEFYLSLMFHHLIPSPDPFNEVLITRRRAGRKEAFLRFRSFKEAGLNLPNVSIQVLLKYITPEIVVDLVKILLLERNLILVRDECEDNALLIEALMMLILPFQWNCINISYLNPQMVDYLEAPMSYVIGVPTSLWQEITRNRSLVESLKETAVFDINKQKLTLPRSLPPLPEEGVSGIFECFDKIQIKDKSFRLVSSSAEDYSKKSESFWIKSTLKIRVEFFKLFVKLLFRYTEFINFDLKSPVSPSFRQIFSIDPFLKTPRPSEREFVTELSRTQHFTYFIEKTFQNRRQEKNELSFFLEGIHVLRTRGEKALDAEVKKVQKTLMRNYSDPLEFCLEDCFKQYKGFLLTASKKMEMKLL